MSKYNVGDKFVIEIGEVLAGYKNNPETVDDNGITTVLHRIKGFRSLVFDKTGLDNLERLDGDYVNENFGEVQDESYEAGLNDAWELAKKIVLSEYDGGMSAKDFYNIFDKNMADEDVLKKFTPKEVLAKLEAYEKPKDEIKVGDVVQCGGIKGVVGRVMKSELCVICADGSSGYWTKSECENTGKHIDISALLEEICEE